MESDRRSWWTRHWKWAAPSGCLVIVLLLFGGCVALFSGVYGMVKDTGAYTQAIERVRSNPDAVAVLGTPVTTGWMLEGRVDDRGATGRSVTGSIRVRSSALSRWRLAAFASVSLGRGH